MQAVKNNKCFIVWSNEIEGRIDAYYYSSKFDKVKKLQNKKTIKFGDLIEVITKGETPLWRGDVYSNSGIPFLKVRNISEEGIKGDLFYISEKIHDRMKRSQLNGGELLYTMAGRIGTATILPDNFGKANINQAIAKIILEKDINRDYIKCLLNSDFCKLQVERFLTTSAQPNINFEQIKDIKIPLLSPETQKKIVATMQSAYDKEADKKQKAKNILNSIDDYILGELEIKMPDAQDRETFCINSQEVNKGRLDCYYYQPKFKQGEKSLKKANCKTEPLKNYITKIHYGASLKNNYVDEGIPLLRIKNLKPNRVILADIVKISEARRKELGNAFVSEGDLLISRSGSVGIVSVMPKEAEGFAFGSFMIKFCLNDKIDKDFVSIWLNNKISQLFIKREKIGAIQGNITIETIENLQIPTPPLATQKKLATEAKERIADAKKINAEAKNEVEKAKQEVENIILGK
jgi:restriction endonuclease S subunit